MANLVPKVDNTGSLGTSSKKWSNVHSTTLTVDDKNILLSQGGNAAAADGAGITIDGANASMLYTAATNSFNFKRLSNNQKC
mgnify:CR=1 FL=1